MFSMTRRRLLMAAGGAAAAAGLDLGLGPAAAQADDDRDRGRADGSVGEWNRTLLRIVRTPGAQPATVHATRSFAILHAAIYDAVVSAQGFGRPYVFRVNAAPGASHQCRFRQDRRRQSTNGTSSNWGEVLRLRSGSDPARGAGVGLE